MTSVQINPQGIEAEYLQALNLCFGNWGDARQYDWYFKRQTSYPETDLIVLQIDGQLAAGSAVSYRRVVLQNDREVGVGIVTGSWTLPQFRRRGCLTQIIAASAGLTAQKGGALLLAFMTEANPSARTLARAGAAMIPSYYLFSTAQTPTPSAARPLRRLAKSEQVIESLFARLQVSGQGYARFVYPLARDFCAQFVNRANPTEVLGDGRDNFGIVEAKADTDLLQLWLAATADEAGSTACLAGFLKHALDRGRQLFLYSTRPEVARASAKLGLATKAGYLTILIADELRMQRALQLQTSLAQQDSCTLARLNSPSFLGHWNVHSGDRA
jgi:hypothetical protein